MGDVDLSPARGRALKHVQVRESLRALVESFPVGSPVPSERELCAEFGVARMTVRQAVDALVAEGLLERRPGRGSFVINPPPRLDSLVGLTQLMAHRGHTVESHTALIRREQAGTGVARALDISPGDAVIHWKRVRFVDDEPLCIEDTYLNEVLLPGFMAMTLPSSLYEHLAMRGLRPTWGEDTVSADLATPDEVEILEIKPGSPVLRVARRSVASGRVVEVSKAVYRHDTYTMHFQVGKRD